VKIVAGRCSRASRWCSVSPSVFFLFVLMCCEHDVAVHLCVVKVGDAAVAAPALVGLMLVVCRSNVDTPRSDAVPSQAQCLNERGTCWILRHQLHGCMMLTIAIKRQADEEQMVDGTMTSAWGAPTPC
jgi:hypothetical protein